MIMEIRAKIRHKLKKNKVIKALTALYFLVALIEIVAEYQRDVALIYATKPLIIPILVLIYLRHSKVHDYFYIAAMVFSWVANFFFISDSFTSIFTGAMFFFVYRILSIYIVVKHTRLPSLFPMVVGGIPFLFVYMYLVYLTHSKMGDGLIIFIAQCLLISFLGGISVGNYILRSNTANTMLLISTLFFAITQFIFAVRIYYTTSNFFQPAAMILFVLAQYLFYRFVILAEKKKAGYKLTKK